MRTLLAAGALLAANIPASCAVPVAASGKKSVVDTATRLQGKTSPAFLSSCSASVTRLSAEGLTGPPVGNWRDLHMQAHIMTAHQCASTYTCDQNSDYGSFTARAGLAAAFKQQASMIGKQPDAEESRRARLLRDTPAPAFLFACQRQCTTRLRGRRLCAAVSATMRCASSSHSTRSQCSSSVQSDVASNDLAASMLLGTSLLTTGSSLMPLAALSTHLRKHARPTLLALFCTIETHVPAQHCLPKQSSTLRCKVL
jgi:hypothetical protein